MRLLRYIRDWKFPYIVFSNKEWNVSFYMTDVNNFDFITTAPLPKFFQIKTRISHFSLVLLFFQSPYIRHVVNPQPSPDSHRFTKGDEMNIDLHGSWSHQWPLSRSYGEMLHKGSHFFHSFLFSMELSALFLRDLTRLLAQWRT